MSDERTQREAVTAYWLAHFIKRGLCSLCGNTGRIDTRAIQSPAGVPCGDVHYCICPNGQTMRHGTRLDGSDARG